MSELARVADVDHLGERRLRVTFTDGLVRELDLTGALSGILGTLDQDEVFAEVSVDSIAGTVCWPNGIDLDPDVLRGAHAPASGQPIAVLREYRLQRAD